MIRIKLILILIAFYTLSIKAQNCVELSQPNALVPICSKVDVSIHGLNNGEVSVIVNGGVSPYQYVWTTGATTNLISNLSAGTYTVTVSDSSGCSTTCSSVVNEPVCTLPSAGSDLTLACNGNQHLNITQLVAASAGYTWYVLQQPIGANATIGNTGLVQGMDKIGEYFFELKQDNYPTCKDDVKIIAPNCVTPCPTNKCGTVSVRKL